MTQLLEPMPMNTTAPKACKPMWTQLWFKAAFSAGVTAVWLSLALIAAARGDWVMMGVDIVGVLTGIAALVWAGHALLQLADTEGVAEFACRVAEQRFDAILALQIAYADRDGDDQWLQ